MTSYTRDVLGTCDSLDAVSNYIPLMTAVDWTFVDCEQVLKDPA